LSSRSPSKSEAELEFPEWNAVTVSEVGPGRAGGTDGITGGAETDADPVVAQGGMHGQGLGGGCTGDFLPLGPVDYGDGQIIPCAGVGWIEIQGVEHVLGEHGVLLRGGAGEQTPDEPEAGDDVFHCSCVWMVGYRCSCKYPVYGSWSSPRSSK
jgi:hypothetical protein